MVTPSGSPDKPSKGLTGLFFGSFNPVHQGHLILAEYFASLPTMNEVWFVLSPQNPLKIGDSMLDFETRAEWIETCIQDNPRLKLCRVEKDFPLPSYTFRTLDHLDKQYPEREFVLLLGEDQLLTFQKWKDYQGNPILFAPKDKTFWRYLLGGSIFGLGWALSGACPGPMVVNIGYGYLSFIVVVFFASLGTYLYGVFQNKLPH